MSVVSKLELLLVLLPRMDGQIEEVDQMTRLTVVELLLMVVVVVPDQICQGEAEKPRMANWCRRWWWWWMVVLVVIRATV